MLAGCGRTSRFDIAQRAPAPDVKGCRIHQEFHQRRGEDASGHGFQPVPVKLHCLELTQRFAARHELAGGRFGDRDDFQRYRRRVEMRADRHRNKADRDNNARRLRGLGGDGEPAQMSQAQFSAKRGACPVRSGKREGSGRGFAAVCGTNHTMAGEADRELTSREREAGAAETGCDSGGGELLAQQLPAHLQHEAGASMAMGASRAGTTGVQANSSVQTRAKAVFMFSISHRRRSNA